MADFKSIRVDTTLAGQVLKLTLATPPGNVLDTQMITELRKAILAHEDRPRLKAIVFQGAGEHFSYGASIPEHARPHVAQLLDAFHNLLRALIKVSKPTFAVARGQCLGGGLELAAFCHWIFASEDARFGQPEIKLGVFPPVASLVLPQRIGQAAADDLILTGRSLTAHEAQQLGLVHAVTADPEKALHDYLSEHILPKSAAALQFAVKAARYDFYRTFLQHLEAVEKLYLQELMATEDADEGIRAFMEKREPKWVHR